MGTKRGVEYFIIMQPDVQTTNWLEKFFILDSWKNQLRRVDIALLLKHFRLNYKK